MMGFTLTQEGRVLPEWIDVNGHMNVMWYTKVFDAGSDAILRRIGISPETVGTGGTTVVAGRMYVAHRKELLLGEDWRLWSGFSKVEPRGLTFTHRLASGTAIRAICEIQANAFCPKSRQPASLDAALLKRARAFIVPGVADLLGKLA